MNPIFIFCLVVAGVLILGGIIVDAIEHHNHMVYMDGYSDAIHDVMKAMDETDAKEFERIRKKRFKEE
jgi:hypothetical protein